MIRKILWLGIGALIGAHIAWSHCQPTGGDPTTTPHFSVTAYQGGQK